MERKNILKLLKSNSKKVAKVLAIIATTLMVEKLVKGNWGLLLVFMALAAVITLVVSNWKAIIAMMPEKKSRKKLSKRAIVVLLLIISLFGIAAVYKNFSGSRKTPAPIVDAEFNDSDNNTNKNDSNNENANNGSSNAPTTSFGYGNGQRFATGDQILNQSKDNTIYETKTEKETNKVSLPGNEKSADQIVKELEDKGEHVVVFEDDIIGIGADKETVTPSAEVTDEEDLEINSDVDSFENHEANTTISTEENADMADADDDETSKMIEEARKNQAKEVNLTDDVNDEIKDDAKEENDLVLTTEPKGFDSVETIEEDTTETVVETAEVEKVTFAGNTNIVKVYVGENGQIIFNESVASIDMDGAQINGNVVTTPVFDEATVGEYTATSVSGQTFTFTFVASSILN